LSIVLYKGTEFLIEALKIEKELDITIVHETHRRRLFWNPFPFNLRDLLLENEELKNVKINLDISHWVVVVSFIVVISIY
jgi:sugar phosphate isomerase/epimerase